VRVKEYDAPETSMRCLAPRDVNEIVPELKPKRNKSQRVKKSLGDDFVTYIMDDEPRNIYEAHASPEVEYWKDAVHSEMDSIITNETWELVELPIGYKPVGCKWIFKRKCRPDGTIEKYKARLVPKGFTQKEGEDYFDTYSPIARSPTIRTLIALAAAHSLLIHQMGGLASRCGPRARELANGLRLSTAVPSQDLSGARVTVWG
jgi:hypothetical protein